MDAVGFSESAPPLYYALAWLWTQVTGHRRVRPALALGPRRGRHGPGRLPARRRAARPRAPGSLAAALVAVNPMLLWYSQEARAYALLVLCALSLLYFVRALRRGGRAPRLRLLGGLLGARPRHPLLRRLPGRRRGASWLLARRGRGAARGLWIVAVAGLAAGAAGAHQMSYGHAEWIGKLTPRPPALGDRRRPSWSARPATSSPAPSTRCRPWCRWLLVVAAFVLLGAAADARRAPRRARCRWRWPRLRSAIPLALALARPGKDYVLARNLLPAAGAAARRGRDRRHACAARAALGAVLGAALVAYSLGFCVWASVSPALQRPDWEAVADAARRAGRAAGDRHLDARRGARCATTSRPAPSRSGPSEGYDWLVHEIDFVSDGPAPPPPRSLLGAAASAKSATSAVGRLYIRRYALPGPT